ncbi:hypothetical protein BD408DRAFT_188651 [Parasitella parasitica]|nr:hypothetical protein BD408DRAFT_188651 [Parasitella parasitica]
MFELNLPSFSKINCPLLTNKMAKLYVEALEPIFPKTEATNFDATFSSFSQSEAFKEIKTSGKLYFVTGLGCLLFGVTFPCFDPNPTTAKRIQFNNLALSFLYRKQILGSPFDGGNTL